MAYVICLLYTLLINGLVSGLEFGHAEDAVAIEVIVLYCCIAQF